MSNNIIPQIPLNESEDIKELNELINYFQLKLNQATKIPVDRFAEPSKGIVNKNR